MKTKEYRIRRIVEEIYYVEATSRKEAFLKMENPYSITVIKETIIKPKKS